MIQRVQAFMARYWIQLGMLSLALGVGANAYSAAAINNRDAVNAAEAKLQGAEFEQFLRIYVAQGDYICSYLTVRGQQTPVVGLPSPPPGLCTVKAP